MLAVMILKYASAMLQTEDMDAELLSGPELAV